MLAYVFILLGVIFLALYLKGYSSVKPQPKEVFKT